MDYKHLAAQITTFLAPYLPYVLVAGESAVKEVGKNIGSATVDKAKALWGKITGSKSQDASKITGLATVLADDPKDETFQAALAKVLAKHLEASPQLAADLMIMTTEDKAVQKVLVEQASTIKNITQKMSTRGTQDVIIRDQSQAGDIAQEQ